MEPSVRALRELAPEPPSSAPPKRGSRLIPLSILCGATAVSGLLLRFAPTPFVWALLAWVVALIACIFFVPRNWTRLVLLNLAVAGMVLAGLEAYFWRHELKGATYSDGYYVTDEVLGYAPAKGIQSHASRADAAGSLYDVTYTIGQDGLRIAPPSSPGKSAGTILFFGCSFTFGEGLNDDQTLPYQLGVQSGGRYRTLNFAFHGYGPEQMLAAIEHGMVGRLVDAPPRYAFYVALPNHAVRVAGRAPWGRHAPRYVLDGDGGVHQQGHFDDTDPKTPPRPSLVARQLNKSALWRVITNMSPRIREEDVRLLLAVVRRSRDLLVAQYPNIQFRVIYWQDTAGLPERKAYVELRDGFRKMGIPVDLAEDILPGYKTNSAKFLLPVDRHPNALANQLLAQYELRQMTH